MIGKSKEDAPKRITKTADVSISDSDYYAALNNLRTVDAARGIGNKVTLVQFMQNNAEPLKTVIRRKGEKLGENSQIMEINGSIIFSDMGEEVFLRARWNGELGENIIAISQFPVFGDQIQLDPSNTGFVIITPDTKGHKEWMDRKPHLVVNGASDTIRKVDLNSLKNPDTATMVLHSYKRAVSSVLRLVDPQPNGNF